MDMIKQQQQNTNKTMMIIPAVDAKKFLFSPGIFFSLIVYKFYPINIIQYVYKKQGTLLILAKSLNFIATGKIY